MKTSTTLSAMVAVAVAVACGCRREPPEAKFRYDLNALKAANVASGLFREATRVAVAIEDPRGVAVGPDDRVYVCGADAVGVYAADGRETTRVKLPAAGHCLAVDDTNTVYVGTPAGVLTLDAQGRVADTWPPINANAYLTSIAVTDAGVFVADAGNRLVLQYDRRGKVLRRLDGRDDAGGANGFFVPSPHFDVAAARDDAVWIVDPGRHRLEKYGYDGTPKGGWGKTSMAPEGFCGCCNPTHIALMSDGRFVTSEKGLCRVKLYDQQGNFIGIVAGPELLGEGELGLDLAVDVSGRILVLDRKASCVRVFEEEAK